MPRYIDANELKEWVEDWLYIDRYRHNGRISRTIPITGLYDILEQIPAADVEKIAAEYCMKHCLVMISMDSYEKLIAYYSRANGLPFGGRRDDDNDREQ